MAVLRNAAAQLKAAEALSVLPPPRRKSTSRHDASAIAPLVRMLGDGRGTRTETPQERAAAVLSDLAKLGENKKDIVDAGGVPPLVEMTKSGSPEAQTHAAGSLWHLAMLEPNKVTISEHGGIAPLVALLTTVPATHRSILLGLCGRLKCKQRGDGQRWAIPLS